MPARRAVGTVASASSGNISPGLPAGFLPFDIHVCILITGATPTLTMSGWTQKLTQDNGTAHRCQVWWRRAVSGDTAPTISGATQDIIARITGYSGCVRSGDPFVAASIQSNAASVTVTAPDINNLVQGCMNIICGGQTTTGAEMPTYSGYTGTNPTYSEAIDNVFSGAVVNPSIFLADGLSTASTLIGSRTATSTSSLVSSGAQLALMPEIVATPTNRITARRAPGYPDDAFMYGPRAKSTTVAAAGGGNLSLSIDTPGSITIAGQSVTTNIGTALSTQGAIAIAGQTVTPALTIPVTNGALTITGQTTTFSFGVALSSQGTITIAGQSVTPALTISVTNGSVTIAGQSSTFTINEAISTNGLITFAGQSVTLANGANLTLSIDTAGAITFAGQSVTLTNATNLTLDIDVAGRITLLGQDLSIALSGQTQEQPSGGYGYINEFDSARARRLRRKRREKEREEDEQSIESLVDRQIAEQLYIQEQKDAEREDLGRIQSLADRLMTEKTELPRPVLAAVIKAHEERTFNALQQLERVVAQMLEEEEAAVSAVLMLLD